MKGFDYAKKVFFRVSLACCCTGSRPVVRQLLKLLMNLESALLRCITGFDGTVLTGERFRVGLHGRVLSSPGRRDESENLNLK
jgi:hypothetical protein